jgi:hypothetical protein
MKISALKIFILVFVSMFVPAFAFADEAPRITVVFQENPLFSNTNFTPGEEVLRSISVTNHTNVSKTVVIEAVNTVCVSPYCLADKLHVRIVSGEVSYFDGTLAQFFSDGESSLGQLAGNASKTYIMSVVFTPGADDNDYQAKTASFDLLVGFRGEEGQSDNGGGDTGGGGGTGNGSGGGGGVVLQGLQINNETASVPGSDGSARIEWNTSYASYGHIIYGIVSGGPYTLNLSEANFGYAASAPSDPHLVGHPDEAKSTHHVFTLTGLPPGEYKYRIVSHASPPTVGYERTFIVPDAPKKIAAAGTDTSSGETLLQNQGEETGFAAGTNDASAESGAETANNGTINNGTTERGNKNSETDNGYLAMAGAALSGVSLPWMFGIGFLAIILGFILAKKRKK